MAAPSPGSRPPPPAVTAAAELSQVTPPPTVKSEIPAVDTKESPSATSSRSQEPSASVSTAIAIPSYSGWFSLSVIHDTERRLLPEFFDGKSASKNPGVYRYYRDFIVRRFRENPARKITFTEVRRWLVGDVGSVRRVFDFLETWGLINHAASQKAGSKGGGGEEKERRASEDGPERREGTSKKFCSSCRSECTQVCFATQKLADVILCARCFVRGNYGAGLTHADFKRVDTSVEEKKMDWTDKDNLHLLEALLQYGDDWKKVAEHVGGGRSERDCVVRFLRLPFGEQFVEPRDSEEIGSHFQRRKDLVDVEGGGENAEDMSPAKKMRLSPLADATNPIMAQVAFLSAMVGPEVSEAAARAAIAALYEVDLVNISTEDGTRGESIANEAEGGDAVATSGYTTGKVVGAAAAEAQSQLEEEQQAVKQSISDIVEIQMKEIQEKIVHFEEVELLMEKEWLQLQYMRNLLFADQLSFLQQRDRLRSLESGEKNIAVGEQKMTAANDGS